MKPLSQLSVRTYGQAPGGHMHDHFQVIWPLQGCLELEIEGKGIALQVGDGLIVRPGDRHDFESREGSRCLVLDSCHARLDQKLRAADLAALAHLSESQFRTRCLEEWGLTPMQWLRQLRLTQAQQYREAGLPVAVIAARVGYETPSALAAAMAKHRRR